MKAVYIIWWHTCPGHNSCIILYCHFNVIHMYLFVAATSNILYSITTKYRYINVAILYHLFPLIVYSLMCYLPTVFNFATVFFRQWSFLWIRPIKQISVSLLRAVLALIKTPVPVPSFLMLADVINCHCGEFDSFSHYQQLLCTFFWFVPSSFCIEYVFRYRTQFSYSRCCHIPNTFSHNSCTRKTTSI